MANPDSKKNIVLGVVALVCLGGAVAAYYWLSGPSTDTKTRTRLDAAAARQAELEKTAPPEPPPPEIERPATKGPTTARPK